MMCHCEPRRGDACACRAKCMSNLPYLGNCHAALAVACVLGTFRKVLELKVCEVTNFFDEYLRGVTVAPIPEYPEAEFIKK